MKYVTITALLLLSGCGKSLVTDIGYGGAHPGEVKCSGQAAITGVVQVGMYSGTYMVNFNCGTGASIQQEMPATAAPATTP